MKLLTLAFALLVLGFDFSKAEQPTSAFSKQVDYNSAIVNYYLWAYAQTIKYLESLRLAAMGQTASTTDKPEVKCKELGEMCVYHSDCCSNSCPSFLGKCVS